MWEMVILPYGSSEFLTMLDDGWEPFAVALIPAPGGLAIPNGSNPMGGMMAMVSLRIYKDERYLSEKY